MRSTSEFLKLDHREVSKYLGMDDIIVRSEETIFEVILQWVEVDTNTRSQHFDSLISNVRLALLSQQYLNTRVKPHQLVKDSKVCEKLIKEAEILRANQKTGDSKDLNVPQYRGSNQLLFLQSNNLSTWLRNPPVLFDFKKCKWKSVRGPHGVCRFRESSCHVYHENIIYSIGGEYFAESVERDYHLGQVNPNLDEREIVLDNQVYSFTLDTATWSVHSYMLTKRKRHQAVICNNKMYAIGGTNELSRTLDSVEMLDISMGSLEWEESVSMNSKRVSHGAVVINNCIYVVGGWDGQVILPSS